MNMPEPMLADITNQRVRTLKIEEDGDPFKGLMRPKIRLMGRWLEQAGFKPGTQVSVTCRAPGIIELRSDAAMPDDTMHTAVKQPE